MIFSKERDVEKNRSTAQPPIHFTNLGCNVKISAFRLSFVVTSSPVEEHAVADGALVSAVARDPGLEAHLVLLQVDRDGVHLCIHSDHAASKM